MTGTKEKRIKFAEKYLNWFLTIIRIIFPSCCLTIDIKIRWKRKLPAFPKQVTTYLKKKKKKKWIEYLKSLILQILTWFKQTNFRIFNAVNEYNLSVATVIVF